MTTFRDEVQAAKHDLLAAASTIQADLIRSTGARPAPERSVSQIKPLAQRDPLDQRRAEAAAQHSVTGIRRADVTELGTITRGGKARTFVVYRGNEYECGEPTSNLAATAAGLVVEDRVKGVSVFIPLRPVDVGTYHRLSGAADPERIDRPREPLNLGLGMYRSLTRNPMRQSPPEPYSPGALLAAVSRKVDLELVGGRLLVKGTGQWIADVRPLARLLAASLAGAPVPCDYGDGNAAVTILAIDVAACEDHA